MTGALDAHAEGAGRIYQATGDQHITEHHHHGQRCGGYPGTAGPDSVRRPSVGRAPVVLRDRAEVMTRLRESIESGRRERVHVLHGMGGCGKTAVAYALFHDATVGGGSVGLWVNASDQASLRAGMLAVAADRGACEGELLAARNGLRPAADMVWDSLDRSVEPWLLVLDNADDPAILRDGSWLRSSTRGTVLVTTRRAGAHWWPGARLQHIGVLPRADAARVLCDLAPHRGTMEQAARVADRLGQLPLALTLAGGFLAHQVIDPWTMDAYGRHLEATDHDANDTGREVGTGARDTRPGLLDLGLIDQGADILADKDARHLVGRTWQLTLDAFEARGLPEAVTLLRLLARLAPEPLPLSVLNRPEINDVLPRGRSESALRALLDHSLTELVDAGERCVHTHGVLLDSVAAGTPATALPTLDRTAVRLLDAAVPAVPDAGPDDPQLRLLAPHALALLRRVNGSPENEEALATAIRLAVARHRTGDYPSTWEIARSAAETGERELGAEHRLVLAAWSRAGRALFRLGRYTEAEELLLRVRAAQERHFGPGDPDTLDTCHGLQLVLGNLGRREEALALARSTVARRRTALGPWHPLTLRSRSGLLVLLNAEELTAEDPDAPLSLPQDCAQHLGPDHTITLGARHNHARALYVLRDFAAADAEVRWVVDEYLRRFGPDYPLTLAARQLLARTQSALGSPGNGVETMTDVVARRARGLGADHPFTVASRNLLEELQAEALG
ncbi:tetratricopeptide repeat protein [Streptomyces nigrescens]